MGWISDDLIRRASARISETAPGRTPIATARPPLVLPGFASPRSIILTSSMAPSFPNFRNYSNSDYQKSSLTDFHFGISEIKEERNVKMPGSMDAIVQLGGGTLAGAARISRKGPVLFGDRQCDQRQIQHRLFPQRHDRPRQAHGAFQPATA